MSEFLGNGMRCPICKKEISWKGNPYRPFCSERCKLIDLGTWADEGHRIPAGEGDDEHPDETGSEKEGGD